jgi:hypothetical protein
MLAWRSDWNRRFLDPPSRVPRDKNLPAPLQELHKDVLRAKRRYRWGIGVMASCLLIAVAFALAFPSTSKPYELGLAFFLGLILALLVTCLVRNWTFPGAFRLCWLLFLVGISAQEQPNAPPWSFRSPAIHVSYRLRLVFFSAFLWAVGLALVTDHFSWVLFVDPDPNLQPHVETGAANDGGLIFLSVIPKSEFSVTYIALAIAACIVMPITIFVLGLFTLAGPTLAGHFHALEATDAYEQR